MVNNEIVLHEYQNGIYNARIYKANGEYGVLLYIAEEDYNEVRFFPTEQQAEIFAEDWVLRT